MNIRPFEWRDLPALHRSRLRGLFLDSRLALTRGPVLVPAGALLTWLAPRTGIFTYLCEAEAPAEPLIGQVTHAGGATFARLSFLAPESGVESADLPALFDQMAAEIGERGAFHVLAEVDEQTPAFQALHRAGFAIYARQRIWKLEQIAPGPSGRLAPWRACSAQDLLAVRSLYSNLVPGLVQQVEPLPREHLKGMVYYHAEVVHAYVELHYGPAGIWAQPFVHPDVEDFPARLVHLLQMLPGRFSRPVYLCVRSYQSWLETAIEALGAVPGPSQAVMVRHLAVPRRATEPYALPAMNGTRTEPVARITEKTS